MTSEEIAEVGEKMLDILDTQGWCKGKLYTPEGQVCLLGALFQALTGKPNWIVGTSDEYGKYTVIDSKLAAFIDDKDFDEDTVATFNNDAHTTVEDVKLLIKRALIEPSLGS